MHNVYGNQALIDQITLTSIWHCLLYCIVFKYLYSAPQHPWANRGALVRL